MKDNKIFIFPLINSIISLIILVIFLILFLNNTTLQNTFTFMTTVVVILTVINLIKNNFGLSLVYLLYLYLTHLGIPIIDIFIDPFKNSNNNVSWYYELITFREMAVALSSIGIVSFCFIVNIITCSKKEETNNNINITQSGPKVLLKSGAFLIFSFTIYFIFMIFSGKISLNTTYSDFHANLVNVPYYSTFILLYAVGMSLIFANMSKGNYKKYIILVLIPAILLLITGNRGEVLFPLAASIGVLIVRKVKFDWKLILLSLMIFFLLIPLVKEFRNFDFNNKNFFEETEISLVDPFVTTGYTLRPFVYTVGWIESNEPPVLGASYFVPFQRGASNFIPFMNPISYENKLYSFRDRLPTMGYSVIAEAYYNFKVFGIIFIMFLMALIITFGDRSNSYIKISIITVINAILINNIRNAFSFVPGQIVMFLILMTVIIISYKILNKDKKMSL